MTRLLMGLWMAALLSACGRAPPDAIDPPEPPGEGLQISVAVPSAIAVGDQITVIALGFAFSEDGANYLRIKGKYVDDTGAEHPFDRTVEATAQNRNKLSWRLWPDVVFHPEGNRLGRFIGEVSVVIESLDGVKRVSDPHDLSFDLEPSLIVRTLHPSRRPSSSMFGVPDTPCADAVVSSTTEDTPLTVAVEAVGLTPGSETEPLVFSWHLPLEVLSVRDTAGTVDTLSKSPADESLTVVDEVRNAMPMSILTDASACWEAPGTGLDALGEDAHSLCGDEALKQRQYQFGITDDPKAPKAGLQMFKTIVIHPDNPEGHTKGAITVSAVDASEVVASLQIPLDIYRRYVIRRAADQDRIVERDAIVTTAEEQQTASLPIEATFRETSSDTKAIDFGMTVSPSARGSIGFIYTVDLTTSFSGAPLASSASCDASPSCDPSQSVPPGLCITHYRQAEKVRRYANVIAHGACGEVRHEGEIYVDDWQWQREIAIGRDCPAAPQHLKPHGPCKETCDTVGPASQALDNFWR